MSVVTFHFSLFQCDDDLTSGGESALTQLSRVMHSSIVATSQIHRLLAQLNAIDFTDVIVFPPILNIFDPSQVIISFGFLD